MSMIGEMIRMERRNKGLTQKELSEKSGIPLPSIKKYELGQRMPKSYNLSAIADALGVGIEKFIGKEAALSLNYIEILRNLVDDAAIPDGARDLFRAMLENNKEDFYRQSDRYIDDTMKDEMIRVYDSFNLSGREKLMAYIKFLELDPENKKK
ncbi:MAG: helix-turn-helix domain-containing protein [Dorea sp.]|nr:helix-turn-helix domain-containing protein [Dorea sp.]